MGRTACYKSQAFLQKVGKGMRCNAFAGLTPLSEIEKERSTDPRTVTSTARREEAASITILCCWANDAS